MALWHVDSSRIRDRAFALAVDACPPSHRLLVLAWATEYRRYLQWCVEITAPKVALRRLFAAAIRWRLRGEWAMISRQRAVIRVLQNSLCPPGTLAATIRAEIEMRYSILLGNANTPASISVLGRLVNLPTAQRQLAEALREQRGDIVGGKVVIRFRNHVRTIVTLYLVASGWLALVFSLIPQIRESLGSAALVGVVGLTMLTFLFSPVIRLIGEDARLRNIANDVPHIQGK